MAGGLSSVAKPSRVVTLELEKQVDDRHRLADQVALDVAASLALRDFQLFCGLDPLGDAVEAEILTEIEDRGDQTAADISTDISHEASVDFYLVQRKTVHIDQT